MHETISYKSFPKPPVGTPRAISTELSAGSSSPLVTSPMEHYFVGAQRSFSATTVATTVTSPSASSPSYPAYHFNHPSKPETSQVALGGTESPANTKNDSNIDSPTSRRRSHSLKRKQNVIVSVRVRPESDGAMAGGENDWSVNGPDSHLMLKGQEFNFDNVFADQDDNGKVYTLAARRIARKVMEGYHGTIFAYGTTGTGKYSRVSMCFA